jgi:hypothetical protein
LEAGAHGKIKAGLGGDLWHEMYQANASEYLSRLGVSEVETFLAKTLHPFWLDGVRPFGGFLMSTYTAPAGDTSNNLFTTWGQVLDAFMPGFATMAKWCDGGYSATPPNCNDFGYLVHHSYQHLFRAIIANADGVTGNAGYSGTSAWDWVLGNSTNQNNYGVAGNNDTHVDPRYAWIPQLVVIYFTQVARFSHYRLWSEPVLPRHI